MDLKGLSNKQKSEIYRAKLGTEAIEDYKNGMSMQQIANKYDVHYDAVRTYMLANNITIRTNTVAMQQYYKYEYMNIFEPMTAEGAYMLGWIYSDGTLSKNTYRIRLAETDRNHVVYLASLVTNRAVYTDRHSVGFTICYNRIATALRKLGIQENKSNLDTDITWSLIPTIFRPYFILGMFEGDGAVSTTSSTCSLLLTDKIYASVQDQVLKPLGITKYKVYRTGSSAQLNDIRFSGEAYYTLAKYMYANTRLIKPLERKVQRFKSACDRAIQGTTCPTANRLMAKDLLATINAMKG